MKYGFVLGGLLFLLMIGAALAQSTATPVYPVILSTTTTGTYACPAGAPLPCAIPVGPTHPLPATTTGG